MPREPADTKPQAKPRPPRPITRRERWILRGLLAAAGLLLLVSLGLTVGQDVLRTIVRRYEAGRMPLAEINPPPRKDLPPPAPELGLPPPPAVSPAHPEGARFPGTTEPPQDPPPNDAPPPEIVVIEPVFDGHMIEPEPLGDMAEAVPDGDLPDPGRNLVDELVQDPQQNAEAGTAEAAPEIAGLKSASARDRIKYASAVKRLLKFLSEGDETDQPEAAKSYAEARRICTDDPRLPLVYGLFLQQIGQTTAARNEYETSALNEGKSYLLILQAAAMSRLMTNDLHRAWPHLVHLADITSQPEKGDEYPTPAQCRRSAEWLGAAATFLESLPDDADGRHLVDVAKLRQPLTEPLQDAFDAGRSDALRHLTELTRWAGLSADDAAGQLKDAVTQLETQHQTAATDVQTLEEMLRTATNGLREALDAEKKARGELNLAGRKHRQAHNAVADLSQPRTYSYTQTTYTYQTDTQGRRQRIPTTIIRQRPENSSERSARLASLQEASALLAKIDAELPGLKSRHDEAKAARDELVAQVRMQTADTRSQLARAQRRLQDTERLLARLQELAADPDDLPNRLKSPTLVLDWSVEDIANRVKATFEPAGKAKGSAPAAE